MHYGPDHLYYEDLSIGQEWESPGRALAEADIRTFAELTGDFNPIHTSPEYAATTPFGRIMAHGMLTLSRASGMSIGHPPVRTIAVVELKNIRFSLPVYPGDVLRVRSRVVAKERKGRGKRGQVTWIRETVNQDNKIVQHGESITLVEAREGPPPLKAN